MQSYTLSSPIVQVDYYIQCVAIHCMQPSTFGSPILFVVLYCLQSYTVCSSLTFPVCALLQAPPWTLPAPRTLSACIMTHTHTAARYSQLSQLSHRYSQLSQLQQKYSQPILFLHKYSQHNQLADPGEARDCSTKYIDIFVENLNLEGHLNRCISSKVKAILLNGWILHTGGFAPGRVCPAACAT